MIIEIRNEAFRNLKDDEISPIVREFFKNEGTLKKDYADYYSAKYVGPVSLVPIEILNDARFTKEYYKNHDLDHSSSNLLSYAEDFDKVGFLAAKEKNDVHIHIPSPELSFFNQVTWIEDECTDILQRQLDDGWRLIAVIPRPGQRRPDYILGRRK